MLYLIKITEKKKSRYKKKNNNLLTKQRGRIKPVKAERKKLHLLRITRKKQTQKAEISGHKKKRNYFTNI